MRVDFYQLTRDPAEWVVPAIARATLAAGERLVVVADPPALLARVDEALWTRLPDTFLAHGRLDTPHAARQPILLGARVDAANGARYLALADGVWRESLGAERVFLLFPPELIEAARQTWRALGQRAGVERKYWRQDGGKWREGP